MPFLAAFSKFGGGLAIILRLLTPIAAFGFVCTMAVAAATHFAAGDTFVKAATTSSGGSSEAALVYFAIVLVLMLVGSGAFSLDWLLFGKRLKATGLQPSQATATITATSEKRQNNYDRNLKRLNDLFVVPRIYRE